MKLHLSGWPSHSLIFLGIIFIGWSTGVLWPVNGFLLNYLVGFIVTLCALDCRECGLVREHVLCLCMSSIFEVTQVS